MATNLTSTSTFVDAVPNLNAKVVYVTTPDTEGTDATVTIPNMATIYMAMAVEITDNSAEPCTVATNVVTIPADVPGGVRILVIGV